MCLIFPDHVGFIDITITFSIVASTGQIVFGLLQKTKYRNEYFLKSNTDTGRQTCGIQQPLEATLQKCY